MSNQDDWNEGDSDWGIQPQKGIKQVPKKQQRRNYQQNDKQQQVRRGGRGGSRGTNNSNIQWREKKQEKLDESDWGISETNQPTIRKTKEQDERRRGGRGNQSSSNSFQQKKKQGNQTFEDDSQQNQQKNSRSNQGRQQGQNNRGNRREQQKRVQKTESNNKQEKIVGDDLQMSNWLDAPQQSEQKFEKKARGASISNMSFEFNSMVKQLEPDDEVLTSFIAGGTRGGGPNRGNRNQPQKQSEQSAPRRGNRDNKGYNERNQERRTQRRYNNYSGNNDGGYNNGYQNGNNYRNNDGYRGKPRGRGGYRGGYQGREVREGQFEDNPRNQGRQQNFNFKKRDNPYISQASDEAVKQSYPNQEQTAPKRGNRGARPQNNNDRPSYNRDFNRDYNNKDYNNNRQHNNYNNRDYKPKDNQYNNYRDYNNNHNNKQEEAKNSSKSYSNRNQKPNNQIQQKKQNNTPANNIPKGRRCWPQSSIYILGCKVAITYRSISDFSSKLLVIPYSNMKMDFYPGNIINSSSIDYKKRILQKGDEISGAGGIYLQKAIDVGKFSALAFLKIDQKRIKDSIKLGVKQLLNKIQTMQGTIMDSILFPICKKMEHFDILIDSFLDYLEECKKIKQVYITTNEPQCLQMAMLAFTEIVKQMLDDNKILFT